jgi:hypothetical protein
MIVVAHDYVASAARGLDRHVEHGMHRFFLGAG